MRVITGLRYKYGKWQRGSCSGANSRTTRVVVSEKVVSPGGCVGQESCSISLGNNWGDPMGGTRKQWVATPICSLR
jgi:hypothetical protein